MNFKWFRNRSQSNLDAYLQTPQLYEWVKPEPIKLKDPEEFAGVFARNLVGTWSNEVEMMPSPMARHVVFKEDGTGYVEGVFFTEYSGEFAWREKEEHLIEVCGVESNTWFPLAWSVHGTTTIYLKTVTSDVDDEGSDLVDSLVDDPLFLSDGRGWYGTEEDETSGDVEEITLNGEPAWISKGTSHWELRQGPYRVTATNTDEDGKDSHFFSLSFIAPKTHKRFTGIFDHAPGHVDREAFLNLAGRIATSLQSVYG